MMKRFSLFILLLVANLGIAQVDLSQFSMSNNSSPAFLLIEETPTIIYIPDNLKALSIYAMDNLGKSLSLEVNPYFFINPNKKDRTFYKYIGVDNESDATKRKQHPFSGLNTTTISFAYLNKAYKGIGNDEKKTYSVGLRTTILRFFKKQEVYQNIVGMQTVLSKINVPVAILGQGEEAIKKYYTEHINEINVLFKPYQKTIKPVFRLDGAVAYSTLFKENTTNSDTANRFGSWLTAQGSMILNEGSDSKYNNYFNLLLTARYIDDGFNYNAENNYFKLHYLDFGGKIAFDYNKFTFGYEFISRNGSITSSRSVGSISYGISKDIVITGGFGKDFSTTNENLLTVFGINWGLNIGKKNISL